MPHTYILASLFNVYIGMCYKGLHRSVSSVFKDVSVNEWYILVLEPVCTEQVQGARVCK